MAFKYKLKFYKRKILCIVFMIFRTFARGCQPATARYIILPNCTVDTLYYRKKVPAVHLTQFQLKIWSFRIHEICILQPQTERCEHTSSQRVNINISLKND